MLALRPYAVRSTAQLVLSSCKAFQAGSRTQFDILDSEQQRVRALHDLAQVRYPCLNFRIRLCRRWLPR